MEDAASPSTAKHGARYMKRVLLATAIALGFTAPVLADEKIVVEFAYPYPHLFDVTYEKQIKKFNKV